MSQGILNRIGVAVLLAAAAKSGFSQATQPSPADSTTQTQEQTSGQTQGQSPNQSSNQSSNQSQAEAGLQTSDTGQSATAGGQSTAQMPVPLNIDSSSLEFSGDRTRGSDVHGGIGVGVNYDDNLLSVTTPHVGGLSYTIAPSIGVDVSRPRLFVDANYEVGYTINQRFSAYDESAHNARIDLRYRLSPHVNLRIYDRFILTSGFYNQLQTGVGGLGSGVVQQPNLGVITPFTRHTYDLGTVELTYQYSANDMVGGSATGDVSSFAKPPAGAPVLINTQSEQGDVFYTHRFTPRNWSGITYTFQRLTFDPVVETVNTHSILLFHSLYLNPNTVLSFFAGPEYTQLNDQIVSTSITLPLVTVNSVATSQDRWSVGGGSSFSWKGKRTSIRASGSRKVNDGGGLLTAVDVTTGVGAVRRQMTRNASLEVGALYADSHSLDQGATTTYNNVKAVSGSVLWEQTIGRNLIATFGYARDYQQQTAASLPTQDINHNRAWVSVGYRFARPLGR